MKPRELARKLIEDGADNTFENVMLEVSKKNQIRVEDLRDVIYGSKPAVKADMDEKSISAEVSRLVYRSNKILIK